MYLCAYTFLQNSAQHKLAYYKSKCENVEIQYKKTEVSWILVTQHVFVYREVTFPSMEGYRIWSELGKTGILSSSKKEYTSF